MKSGHGSFKWMRTRPGSTTWTSRTRSLKAFTPAPRYRSSENLTSSAVTGSPLWNFAPLRRTNSYARPSLETVHDSARLGARGSPGIGFTTASCSAYMIMNGVMIPGVSAGSNQVGASEMWTPQVICPSGAARDGVGVSHVTAERSVASAARTHRFSNGAARLMVIASSRVASFGTSAQGKGTGTREWRDYRACATVRATRRCFMTRRALPLALLAVIATAGAAVAEVCLSPWVKRLAGPEKYLYVYAVDADAKDNDFLAVVDVNLASPTYGRVVNTVDLGSAGNEPHHMGFTDDRTKIWAGTLLSKRLFILDTATDPAKPRIVKAIDDIGP